MAVKANQYAQALEKYLAQGKSFGEAHKLASQDSSTSRQKLGKKKQRYKSYSDMNLIEKTKTRLKELLHGSKTYSKRKFGK